MSKVEQSSGKTGPAKKSKIDADSFDLGGETPIERMDIVLPGQEEIGAGLEHENQQPLESGLNASASQSPGINTAAGQNTNSNNQNPSANNAPASENTSNPDNNVEVQNTPSLDGVNLNSVQAGAGAPLAPELNALDEGSNTSNANQQGSTSSGGGATTPGGSDEVNVAPTDIVYSNSSVDENASGGTVIATLSTVDANDSDTHTYTIVSDPSGYFEIVGDEIRVKDGADLDFETAPLHKITIQATDSAGNSFTETMTIDLNDLNEHDVSSISDTDTSANTIAEDVSNGDSVGITASATDADGSNNTVTYSLSDDAGGIFEIDANTGEVSIADASGIDYENATSHTIEVTATSADGSTSTQSYTINVTDVDEFDVGAVTDTDSAANTIAENASAGDEVGVTASATDADGTNNTVTYSVDDARFEVASDGTVTVASGASFDAETEGSIDIEVTATSADGSTSTETFSINVSDIDEFDVGAVSDSNASSNAVDENASVGDTVGITALASDGDVTDGVTYSLSDDAGGLFDIDVNTGVVTVAGSLDAETSTSHTIEVTATSDDGSTSTQTFSIGVNDVNETSISAISDTDASGNTVTEGASVGTAVGITALASDADATDTVSYSLSSNPGGFFAIDANTGEVTVAGSLDYETDTSHTIEVTATSSDGTTSTQTFTIAVGDEDEHDVGSISDTDSSANTIAEDVSNGDSVGITASATDADGSNNTVTYSLSDDAGGIFEIDATTGEVSIADASGIDYENATSHTIEVTATSADGSTSTQSYTINVTDIDEFDVGAVTDTDSAANTIAENASAGDEVGVTASATDADGTNNTVTYSVDDARFEVASDGTVTVATGASFDAETEGSIDIEVTATSADGSTSTETFSINVSDIDEFDVGAVSDSNASSNAVDENASVGDTVGITALASDGDVTDGVTYSLSDDAGGLFDIDANTGVVTVAGSLDAETSTSHTIEVTATSDDGTTSTQTFSIGVNDVNETSITAISDTDGTGNTVTEGASVGTAVGITALASDADATDTVSYSLSSNPGGFFAIDANTGEVTVAGSLDYETDTSHTIEVTATSSDGTTSTQTFTIAVGDEDEHDVGSISDTDGSANTIAEDVSNGDSVGITASATDADGSNNTVTYSLSDDAGGIFEIDANTGEVSIADASGIDYENATSHTIEVTATSADGSTSTQSYTINVTDVDEFDVGAVTDTDSAANTIAEDVSNGDSVGITASATDADGSNNTVTYSLSDDAGGIFEIDATTGEVSIADASGIDHENATSHTIEVTATSADGSTSTQSYTINVTDVDEFDVSAISDTDASANSVDENAAAGTTVGIVASATDGDATNSDVTYSLSDDAGGLFTIDASTGEVTTTAPLDAETASSYDIEVTATSEDGSTSTTTFTVDVNNLMDEGPTDITFTGGTVNETVADGGTIDSAYDPSGSTVATLSATDADSGDTFTYAITNDPSGHFEIVGNEVRVKSGQDIDFETAESHDIAIEVTDAGGNTYSETITINVQDYEGAQTGTNNADTITGTSEEDNITGGNGNDTIYGGAGDDTIDGGYGSDTIYGGAGDDVIYEGSDGQNAGILYGEEGNDTLYTGGGTADDQLYGGEGDDTLIDLGSSDSRWDWDGSTGDDLLDGGAGNDDLQGGLGQERLIGGEGNDTIDGGDDTDTAVYSGSWSDYTITESDGTYTIVDNRDGSPDGTDTVANVENFEFADGTVGVADLLDVGPSDIDVSSDSVDENSASGTVVATLSATDNALDSHTYAITNDPSGFFEISGDKILVKAGADIDFEDASSHDVTIEVTDANGNTYSETITLDVNDLDEFDVTAVSDTDTSANTIAEDVSNGESVGITASATDADGSNNTVTYSLSDDAGGIFEIDANTGEVSIADASGIDYENATSHTIEVTATSADGSTSTQSYTINVTDVDEFDVGAVTDTDSAANTIAENASAGDEVGVTASATDADGTNNTVTYSVDDARFEVASDGTVTVASGASFDAETEGSIDIEVTATSVDGSTSTETFSINVSDIDEFDVGAVSDSNASSNAVDENASVGDTVGITALASDGDVTDGVTYSLSDDAGGLFDIDANTGVVTVAGSLDAETSTSHTIEVTATSDDGSTSTQTFSIGVNDVNETSISAISDSDASGNTVTEGASVGTAVGITALASDADATDTVSYSLSSNPGGFFAIDANTGEVTVAGSLDYETDTSHTIEVTATSSDGTTSTQTFTIAVGDEAENVQLADGGVTFTDTGVTETSVIGGTGDDTITGTSGDDVIGGNAGNDVVNAGAGNDKFDDSASGNGDDTVNMGAGDDYAYGGDGSDVIDGGTGEDFIHGEDGNDTLTGGADDDTIRGGDGVDIAVFSGDRADYTISHSESPYYDGGVWTVTGPDGTDTVMEIETFRFDDGDYSAADLQETADQTIVGTVNDDVLNGGSGNDTISGLSGDDVVNAGAGDDRFDDTSTGNGNDTLNMGEGNDIAYGGDGTDTINGDEGDDKLYGESGNDTITGGEGNDAIDGGTGDDTAVFSGNWADYTITESGGTYTVVDNRPGSPDGTDTVKNVEFFEFADGTTTADDVIDVGPSDIDLSATSIDENSSAGTVVATLSAEDNSLDVQSYTITNDPSGFFEISGDQVVVKAGADIDFENATSHDITIEVSDGAGSTYTETITIDVTDIDEFDVGAVTDTDSAANTIAENASAGDEVGVTASATDADGTNNTVTYSVDDARFEIASDGTVTVASGASFDAESEGSIDIEVTATSADGSTSTETFSINVSDIDEFDVGAVSDSNASSNAVDENASVGDTVGITALASDGDVTDGVTYSLSDDAGGLFDIDANTGVVTVAGSLDAETSTSHTIEVTATSDDGSTSTQTFAIGVNDVNETSISAISDTDGTGNTVTEGASVGTAVGITALASDADATDTVSYSLSSNPGGFFAIDANTGEVTVAGSLDYETDTSHTIEVTATSTDGTTSTQTFTIAVGDEDEHDVSSISDTDTSANTIAEDVSNGDSVGITASATDADGSNNTVTYSLSDDAVGIFEIDANTGEVSIADASGIDYENATTHTIEVTATSADGSTSTQSYTINVTDIDEFDVGAVTDTDSAANTIAENASAGDEVGVTASATDADGTNNTVTYSVDDARFEVTSDGTVTVASGASFDAETKGSIDIEVTATSADGSTSTETFSINVSDIDEFDVGAVSDSNASSNAVDENASVGDTVGITALASDGDVTDGVTYSLSDDAGGLFDIDANTGVVTVAGSLDAETSTSHTIEVTATSDDGSTSTQTFSIGVNDVNETSISAISDSDASGNTVTEGASVGTTVGITALASDADATDTVSYSLSSNPGGFFAIDANTGEVTVAGSLDYETDTSHTIEVTATSSDGTTSTQTFTIAVGDENEGPTDISFTGGSVDETVSSGGTIGSANDPSGSTVATLSATDEDAGETFSYAITNDPSGHFEIVGNEVRVKSNQEIDYEAAQSHDITIEVTDAGGNTYTETITINVQDYEGSASGTSGHEYFQGTSEEDQIKAGEGHDTILGGDGDDSIAAGDGNDAIIGGAGADAIDGGDGEDTARYDGSSSGVSVDLSSGTGSGGDAEGDVLKNVENLQGSSHSDKLAGDEGENTIHGMSGDDYISGGGGADTLDGGSGSDEIDGGAGADTIYGGSGDDNLDGGADNDVLQGDSGNDTIDGGDGEDTAVYTGNWADYTITESGGTYKIVDNRPGSPDGTDTVTNVEDFEFADGTVAVADLLNVGPSDIDVSSSTVDENSASGTVVATLSTTDNALDTHTYSITKDPSGLFEISGDQIVVKAGADIDYEDATSHEILVEVTDAAGETYSETITINVTDVDEFDVGAVTDTDSATNTIAENASAGDEVGVTASATDADGTNNTVTYSVDDARFEVASDGTVTVASGASFDAETEGSIDIEVTATSADGSTSTETFSINVSDIDEFDVGAVSDSNASSNAVDENASVGDTVGITALASDGDVTDGVTYSLSDDAGGLFDIDANTGVVTVAGSLDAETSTSHTIEVTATSDDGSTSTQTFSIGVNDVNETSITAISDTDASGNTVTEGASVGTAVGITALASDADATDTVSYSLSSNPGGFFAIDANTGEVTVAGSLDYETDTSHTIEVTATSSDGTTSTQTFTIAVGDEDEHDVSSISDTDTSANTIAEDVSNGDSAGITASATDADGSNNTITYSLSDDAGGIFEIDATTGEVSIADASGIDYENATSHTIEVTATSADGSTSTQSMTVNVSDVVDENPTDIQLTGTSGNLIQNGSFESFEVADGSWNAFASDASGAWQTDTTMEVWDNLGGIASSEGEQHLELDSASGATDGISQTISTTNGQVYNMSLDAMERSGSGGSDTVEIYWNGELVTTVDPSSSWDSYEFQVVGTGGEDVFELREPSSENNGNGALIDNVVMEEVPLTIAEGVDGAVIGTLTTTDADASDSHTYTISDTRFEVVDDGAGNMQLKLKDGESFDYETETSVDITVTTTDAAGNNYNEDFTITVADVSDLNPTDLTLDANENLDITTVDAVLNDAVVTGEIVHDGDAFGGTNGGASVDHWQINHNGGDLVIDALADGLNGDDLDVKIMLYLDDGAGNFTLVASNDDGSRGADGSTSGYDSYISETNLAAGTYMVAVGNYHMDGDAATNTSMTHPGDDYSGSYNHGPYQLTISGNNTVEYADHPTGSGSWGDPDGHAVVVSDGADVQGSETLAAGSVIGSVDNVVDIDTNETFTFALTDDAGGKFEIDADTGEIKLVAEHDASSAYSDTLDVQVTDAGGNTYTETVGIQLGTEDGETLTGTSNSDIMHGFGGQDTLNGGDGDDILVASDGTAGAVEELTLNDTGTDAVASVSNLFSVDLDEISFEVNLSVDNIPSSGATIVSYATMDGSSMHDNEFTIMLQADGSLDIIINQTSQINTGALTTDLTDGSEHRLSVTWDNSDGGIKVYVDGAEEYSVTGIAQYNMIDGGGTLTLGQEQDSVGGSYDTNQIFSGTMDDVRIFNDVRTATEIADNHDSQLANPSSTSNLVANWQFDGESGTTVTDLANHYDLTLSGDASLEEGAVVGDTLNGGDGDDIMISATGNDTIDGGAGTDTVSYQGSDSAVNVNLNTDTLSGGDAEGDTLTSIENVTGSDHDDTLAGDSAANTLVGGDGNDTLDGLSGKDTLDGGAGDDILMAGFDDGTGDIFIGGEGNDTYQIEGSTVENYGFNVDLNTGSDQYNNSYSGIENINGGNGNDTFTGDANANTFSGGGGNDTMYGGDEGDIFVFGEGDGADTVHGGAGGGWTDTIELTDAGGDLGTYGSDWTVSLTSGSIDAQDANSLTLSDDADGTITLADGSTVDFFEIERIEF